MAPLAAWLIATFTVSTLIGESRWSLYTARSGGIQYRDLWTGSACGKHGEFYYYQFRNGNSTAKAFEATITYVDADTSASVEFLAVETLGPGEESEEHGAWLCAQRRPVFVNVRNVRDGPN
jgi:hypothetical protein